MPGRYYEKLKLSKELLGFRETFLALQLCDKKIISLTLNYFSCQAEFSTVCYIGILHILCADFDIFIALLPDPNKPTKNLKHIILLLQKQIS